MNALDDDIPPQPVSLSFLPATLWEEHHGIIGAYASACRLNDQDLGRAIERHYQASRGDDDVFLDTLAEETATCNNTKKQTITGHQFTTALMATGLSPVLASLDAQRLEERMRNMSGKTPLATLSGYLSKVHAQEAERKYAAFMALAPQEEDKELRPSIVARHRALTAKVLTSQKTPTTTTQGDLWAAAIPRDGALEAHYTSEEAIRACAYLAVYQQHGLDGTYDLRYTQDKATFRKILTKAFYQEKSAIEFPGLMEETQALGHDRLNRNALLLHQASEKNVTHLVTDHEERSAVLSVIAVLPTDGIEDVVFKAALGEVAAYDPSIIDRLHEPHVQEELLGIAHHFRVHLDKASIAQVQADPHHSQESIIKAQQAQFARIERSARAERER